MDVGGLVFVLIAVGVVVCIVLYYRAKDEAATARSASYGVAINQHKQRLLGDENKLNIPTLDPFSHRYRCVAGESLLSIQRDVSKVEYKGTGRYSSRGASVSIPLGGGFRYRVGGASIQSGKAWQMTATGRLLVTDKAFVFESPQKNERITWGQVASVELMLDGFKVMKRSGPPRLFRVDNPDPGFAAIVELLLSRE